ncbi:MAG: hypothetical protein AB7E79_04120 [Rhodospirillaceae bacterium]
MTRIILLLLTLSLTACYSSQEYAVSRSALAPGAAVVGGPVKGINPVSGELIGAGIGAGSGMPVRSLGNPRYQRYDPMRLNRND